MKKFCLAMALLLLSNPAFAAASLDLEAENIAQIICHTSQYTRVVGTISDIEISDRYKVISLNFGKNYNTSLSAIIYNDAIPAFINAGIEDPAVYYKDKTVLLEGIVRISSGKPEIIIESPSQIKIVNENEVSR